MRKIICDGETQTITITEAGELQVSAEIEGDPPITATELRLEFPCTLKVRKTPNGVLELDVDSTFWAVSPELPTLQEFLVRQKNPEYFENPVMMRVHATSAEEAKTFHPESQRKLRWDGKKWSSPSGDFECPETGYWPHPDELSATATGASDVYETRPRVLSAWVLTDDD